MGFWAELQRRSVIRVGAAYLIAAWLVLQVVNTVADPLALPPWTESLVVVLLGVGFPIALVIAWAFELSPTGVKRTAPAAEGAAPAKLAVTDIALLVAVVALVGVSLVQIAQPRSAPVAAGERSATALSVAVLPFADMSPEGDQEYFSDGLSEELLNSLAQIPELRVAGRTSSFAFKGHDADLRTIGEQLGVANILEGSVRKSGDRLRITAQLVSAADGYHLWSATYDRQLDDVFAVQEEIAMAVADALSVTLGVEAIAPQGRTDSVEVYDLYLRGMALARTLNSPEDILRAADILRGVIALDPDFTRARVALAGLYVPIIVLFPERTQQSVAELEAIVADALEHAPDDPNVHFANGVLLLQRQEWLAAEREFAGAGDFVGEVFTVPYPATLLLTVGQTSEAVDMLVEGAERDPLAADVTNMLQQALTIANRYEEADAERERTSALPSLGPIEHVALIRAWTSGDDALIRAQFDRYIDAQTVEAPFEIAVRAVYDDPEAALAIIREAADQPDMQDASRQLLVGLMASLYGDPDLALTALRRSLVEKRGLFVQVIWLPNMGEARRKPAFKELVRDLGLVDYWRATGNWGEFCRPVGADDFECS